MKTGVAGVEALGAGDEATGHTPVVSNLACSCWGIIELQLCTEHEEPC